jgi:hypothetical protein
MAGVVLGGRIAASLLPSPYRFGCFGFSSLVAESYLEGVRRRNCVFLVSFLLVAESDLKGVRRRNCVVLVVAFGLCVECVDDFC